MLKPLILMIAMALSFSINLKFLLNSLVSLSYPSMIFLLANAFCLVLLTAFSASVKIRFLSLPLPVVSAIFRRIVTFFIESLVLKTKLILSLIPFSWTKNLLKALGNLFFIKVVLNPSDVKSVLYSLK